VRNAFLLRHDLRQSAPASGGNTPRVSAPYRAYVGFSVPLLPVPLITRSAGNAYQHSQRSARSPTRPASKPSCGGQHATDRSPAGREHPMRMLRATDLNIEIILISIANSTVVFGICHGNRVSVHRRPCGGLPVVPRPVVPVVSDRISTERVPWPSVWDDDDRAPPTRPCHRIVPACTHILTFSLILNSGFIRRWRIRQGGWLTGKHLSHFEKRCHSACREYGHQGPPRRPRRRTSPESARVDTCPPI